MQQLHCIHSTQNDWRLNSVWIIASHIISAKRIPWGLAFRMLLSYQKNKEMRERRLPGITKPDICRGVEER